MENEPVLKDTPASLLWAKVSEVSAGDTLVADDGFTCLRKDDTLTVEYADGLYVRCDHGRHYLSGQLEQYESGDRYVGFRKVNGADPYEGGYGKVFIVTAAVRLGDLILSLPRPARHHNIIQMPMFHALRARVDRAVPTEQGFLTSRGKFADRKEACAIALANGQLAVGLGHRKKSGPEDTLFSEDLW